MDSIIIGTLTFAGTIFLASGVRIVRPTHQAIIETLGKFSRIKEQGFAWIIPVVQQTYYVNITEQMVDSEPQIVITKDNLNVEVDAVIYYQVQDTKKSIYNVDNHRNQLSSLARTTLRAVIGKMSLTEANENRDQINIQVEQVLSKETKSYGVNVLRVEIQKVEPPKDVQESMNEVVKAERKKIAATDLSNAKEIEADGFKRAEIKKAEGIKQSLILKAQGDAEAIIEVAKADSEKIKLVNESIQKHFKNNAVEFKKLETVETAMKRGSKYVIDSKSNLTTVLSEVAGVTPISKK